MLFCYRQKGFLESEKALSTFVHFDFLETLLLMNLTTKPPKSKAVAALLVIVFGPLGVFYSSFFGGIVMTFLVPAVTLLILFTGYLSDGFGIILFLLFPFYYVICLIWALSAVSEYNWKITHRGYLHSQYPTVQQTVDATAPRSHTSKTQLYSDLNSLEYLYKQKIISEDNYVSQKNILIEQLNESNFGNYTSKVPYNNEHLEVSREAHRKSPSIFPYLLIVVLFLFSAFVVYEKGLKSIVHVSSLFDTHRRDKQEIKSQIEKVYFGLSNGNYTVQTIGSIGEGIPVYNLNINSLTLMGLAPVANMLSKFELQPKNVNVYNFIDQNTANVSYDLFVITNKSTNSTHIDMVVKKIGGVWKLDGNKLAEER